MTPQTTFVNGISPFGPPPVFQLPPKHCAWNTAQIKTVEYIALHPRCTCREVADALGEPLKTTNHRVRAIVRRGLIRYTKVPIKNGRFVNLLEVVQ